MKILQEKMVEGYNHGKLTVRTYVSNSGAGISVVVDPTCEHLSYLEVVMLRNYLSLWITNYRKDYPNED